MGTQKIYVVSYSVSTTVKEIKFWYILLGPNDINK